MPSATSRLQSRVIAEAKLRSLKSATRFQCSRRKERRSIKRCLITSRRRRGFFKPQDNRFGEDGQESEHNYAPGRAFRWGPAKVARRRRISKISRAGDRGASGSFSIDRLSVPAREEEACGRRGRSRSS